MHYCYVIYSQTLNKYYIGETENVEIRLEQHNNGYFKGAYTKPANDWSLFLVIPCQDIRVARKLEKFIKRQKSRSFIERLKNQPELLPAILAKLI